MSDSVDLNSKGLIWIEKETPNGNKEFPGLRGHPSIMIDLRVELA